MENNNLKTKFDMLLSVLHANMESLKEASDKGRKQAFWMKLSIVILSTSITFVLGVKEIIYGPYIALFISCIVTVLTTMDQFLGTTSNFKLLRYRFYLASKLALDVDLYIRDNKNLSHEKWDEYKERFDEIVDESNKYLIDQNGNKENQNDK